MENNRLKIMALALSLTLLISPATAGCGNRGGESQQQELTVKRSDIVIKVSADGNLSLIKERKLTFGTSGTVTEINADEGDVVKEGDVLARLDTESLDIAVDTAELALKSATIDVEIATDAWKQITYPYTYYTFAFGVPESLAAISDAQNRLEDLQSGLSESMTAEQYNEAQNNLQKAMDSLIIAREKLGRGEGPDLFLSGQLPLSSFWTLREAQLNLDKANLALDRAANDLKRAQDELPKTVITAPFDGLIAQLNLKVGDKLSSGEYNSRVVFDIIDPGQLELKATVDEIDIPLVALGQEAEISLDALPEVTPTGTVTYISPLSRTEGGVIVYDIKVAVDAGKYPAMKSGMTAKADVIIERHTGVLTVSERAIYENANGEPAVKVKTGTLVEERVIKTGLSNGIETEVTEGLKEGDTVVIERRTTP